MEERERKRKVWGTEGETRWREGFGSPKNLEWRLCQTPRPQLVLSGPWASKDKGSLGDAKCVTEILVGTKIRKLGDKV